MSPSPDPYLSPAKIDRSGRFGGPILRPTRVYLAGPMRGHLHYNFPAFQEAAERLTRLGYDVWSPAQYDLDNGFDVTTPEDDIGPLSQYMKVDLPHVLEADALVLLDGWEGSTGASLEHHVASVCGIPSYSYDTLALIEGKQMDPDNGLNAIGDDREDPMEGLQVDPDDTNTIHFRSLDDYKPFPHQKLFFSKDEPDQHVVTNAVTGGQKETRPARFDLLPWDQLWRVAELYAYGATKYDDRNWEKGYQFSLSIAALQRHMAKFIQGESYDQESGQHHLASVVFHALALMRFEDQIDKGYLPEELDNRPNAGFEIIPEEIPGQLTIHDLMLARLDRHLRGAFRHTDDDLEEAA